MRTGFSTAVEFSTTLGVSELRAVLQRVTGSRFRLWTSEDQPLSGQIGTDFYKLYTRSIWLRGRGRVLVLQFQPASNGGTYLRGVFRLATADRLLLLVMFGVGLVAMIEASLQDVHSGGSPAWPLMIFSALGVAAFFVFRFDISSLTAREENMLRLLQQIIRHAEPSLGPAVEDGTVIRPKHRQG